MKIRDLVNISAGIALGVLLAWLLGLWGPSAPPAPIMAAVPLPAARPAQPIITTMVVAHSNVAMPTAPAVPAHAADPSSPAAQPVVDDQAQQRARLKAVTNNLRQLANAAQSYMMEKSVTSAGYYDLVGDSTDDYLRSINPVEGEDYTGIYIQNGQSQVELTLPDGTTVTYNL
jgi:hypothetical protein